MDASKSSAHAPRPTTPDEPPQAELFPLQVSIDEALEDLETHHSCLERLECSFCFGGYVTITTEEDGDEHTEAVACKRCQS